MYKLSPALRQLSDPSYEPTKTPKPHPLLSLHSFLTPNLKHCSSTNPILICPLPFTSLPVSTPNTIHNSRLTVYLPDSLDLTSAVRRPRGAAAADNLWAPPPPTFVDRRAAADNFSAYRRCHHCCVVIFLQFSLTKENKKGHQKILRIERNFSGIFEKILLAARAAPPTFFGTADQN